MRNARATDGSSTGRSGVVGVVDPVVVDPGGFGATGADRAAGRGRGVEHRDRGSGRGGPADGDLVAGALRRLGVTGLDDERRSGRPRTVDRAKILAATLTPPPAQAGDHALVVAAARRPPAGWSLDGAADLAAPSGAAVAGGDVQVLHRPGAGRQGHRRGRVVPASAGERDRAECGREVADPSAEPDPEDAADAARAGGAADPRLRPARHHHVVRRARDRHRRGHWDLQAAAPAPGVPDVPAARGPRLPRPATNCI